MIKILAVYPTEYITSTLSLTNYTLNTKVILSEYINQTINIKIPIDIDIQIE